MYLKQLPSYSDNCNGIMLNNPPTVDVLVSAGYESKKTLKERCIRQVV